MHQVYIYTPDLKFRMDEIETPLVNILAFAAEVSKGFGGQYGLSSSLAPDASNGSALPNRYRKSPLRGKVAQPSGYVRGTGQRIQSGTRVAGPSAME